MRNIWLLTILLAAPSDVIAQNVISTFAGTDSVFQDDGRQALTARLGRSEGIAVDAKGNVYVSDYDQFIVYRIGTDGTLRVIAGNGLKGFSGDGGLATSASFSLPTRLAIDAAGNVFVADAANNRIRRVSPTGIISTVAGTATSGFSGDGGRATQASLFFPRGVAVDAAGNLYIADTANSRVRRVAPDGIIRTIAGNGSATLSGDGGPALQAGIGAITGIAVDPAGSVYVSSTLSARVRKISVDTQIITTFAGGGAGSADGVAATSVSLNQPTSVQFDDAGVLYINEFPGRIRRVTPDGLIRTIAGALQSGYSGDGGDATRALLGGPLDTAARGGAVYIADAQNFRVRIIDPNGIINTYAGSGLFRSSPDGTPSTSMQLSGPTGVAADSAGNLFIADFGLSRIRKVTKNGLSSTIAGTGAAGSPIDGQPAAGSRLAGPFDVAAGPDGSLYIADSFNFAIRRISPQGIISRFAGGGSTVQDGGPATATQLNQPQSVAVDANGVVYISDTANHRIRKVARDGTITTIAGTGTAGFLGDNGPATQAQLSTPRSVRVDTSGNVFVADFGNRRIRKVSAAGIITTVAGNGTTGTVIEGSPATAAPILNPLGVVPDATGGFFVSGSTRVYRVTAAGLITTYAGTATAGFAGDGGLATRAQLNGATFLTLDAAGNLYIADSANDRVRVVLAAPGTYQASPTSFAFSGQAGGPVPASQSISLSSNVPGLAFSVDTAQTPWLSVTPTQGTMPAVLTVAVDPANLAAGPFTARIAITAVNATPSVSNISVRFDVAAQQSATPKLALDTASLSFAFAAFSRSETRQIVVRNAGGGTLTFSAIAAVTSGANWLSVAPASATATPAQPATLTVTANPAGLAPGVYQGNITVASAATRETSIIPITATVTAVPQTIQISQTGLTYVGVASGGTVLPQSVSILNGGQGIMNWTARATTLSGGPGWLSVTPVSGATDASASTVPTIGVSVNPAGLAAGTYYGQVRIASPTAVNSPQSVSVAFSVLPAGTNPGPLVRPASLVFAGAVGDQPPGSQNLLIGNPGSTPLDFASGRLTLDGASWFVSSPTNATVTPDLAATIVVQSVIDNLTPGVRRGVLTLLFSDGSARTVNLLLVLTGGGTATSGFGAATANCTPTRLLPLFTTLTSDMSAPAAWPTAVEARIVDDCGAPMTTGAVTVSFSNGDPPINLLSLKDGRWSATWQPRNAATSQVTVSLAARLLDGLSQGVTSINLSARTNLDPPQVGAGAIVSAASLAQPVIAPGSVISIFGAHFADSLVVGTDLPLATEINGTEVILAGRSLPLLFVSPGQVNALVPNDVPVNATHQLVVRRNDTLAVPEPVSVAAAQPAIFTTAGSGRGQGFFIVQPPGAAGYIADPSRPAKAGDAIIIYCAGLGTTNPAVPAGSPASTTVLSNLIDPVTVRIADKAATVFFAGLAPGFVGVYQVNAFVPAGLTPGDAVPVTVSVSGLTSPPATMAIR